MRRFITKSLILIAVFIASVAIFYAFMNTSDTQSTKGMDEPSLPLLYMKYDDKNINRMYGYTEEIDEETLRNCVTLLPVDRTLTVSIDTFGNSIEDISYAVTSFDDGSIVENGRIKSLETSGQTVSGTFRLDTPVTMGREYMLRFAVNAAGFDEPVYYYTRLVQRNGQNLNWYLDFTDAFYTNCISGNLTAEMKKQLEPLDEEKNFSLHTVNIHSDPEMIIWGDLNPTLVKKAVPTLLEINETTVSVELMYIISSKSEDDETEYYRVKEFYRMRKNQDEVVLLDFEREAEQFFDGSRSVLGDNTLSLGIDGKDIRYVSNDSGDIIAFAKAGEIWEYDRGTNKVSRVFSYRGSGSFDDRAVNSDYSLSISSVAADGTVTFIVSGYMPGGSHEGMSGISMYRYNEDNNTTKELLFIPVAEGSDILNRSLSRLAYVNEIEQCFICYGDSIVGIELSDLSSYYVQKEMDWDTFAVSDSQTLVSWMEEDEDGSDTINELNLDTGDTISVKAPEGQLIKNLGFIYEDLVYGLAYESDCYTDATGNSVFPMYRICIVDSTGAVKKSYEPEGIYVTGVSRDGDMLRFKRAVMGKGSLSGVSDDQLLYYEPEDGANVTLRLSVTERQGTIVNLVFPGTRRSGNLYTLTTRYLADQTVPTITLEAPRKLDQLYYVYAKGGLYGTYTAINEAIEAADGQVGVVLNRRQQYVWERGNIKSSITLDIASIPQGLLEAPIEESLFREAVGDDVDIWNLTDCSLASIRYQISNGYPVAGRWSENENALIIGYDIYNIWLYDKQTGEPKAYAFEDAEAAFAAAGNVFLSYHS